MRPLCIYAVAALGLTLVWGQIGGPQYPPGGGYPPGGQYPRNPVPRIPFPRRGKKTPKATKEQDDQLMILRGMLRQLDEKELVLEAPDKRILRVSCAKTTKYLKDAAEMKSADLQPGDQLMVEASQDDQGRYSAVRVNLEKAGTAAERAAARTPIEPLPRMSDEETPPPAQPDDERPVLRRAGTVVRQAEPAPRGPAQTPEETPPAEPEDESPVLRRAGTVVRQAEPERDPDDEGPPRIARGKPAPRKPARTREEPAAAPTEATPVAAPREATPEAPPLAPEPKVEREPDPFVEKAREMAVSFVESLPNYTVKQITTRFVSTSSKVDWQAQDSISSDVVYENGRESYRNVLLNGKPAKGKVEETGAWSTGEFGTVLRDLFSPTTAADFRSRNSATIANRAARVFNFYVEQPNSHWHVIAPGQSYKPAYRGAVWIDRETTRVLRIEMQARAMPSDFPLDTVESATDYEFVRIGPSTFLLPTHSETLSCVRGTSQCSRNVIEFRNYRKFGAESNVEFIP